MAAGACVAAGLAPPETAITCKHYAEAIEKSIGFCQAVRAGNVLYLSGMVGVAPMETAVPRVYENLRKVLEANGFQFSVQSGTQFTVSQMHSHGSSSFARAR